MTVYSSANDLLCPLLRLVSNKGNVTTYEWKMGTAPDSVIETALLLGDNSQIDEKPQDEDVSSPN